MTSLKSTARTPAKWFARVALGTLLGTLIVLGIGPRAGLFQTLVVRSGSMGAAMPTGSLAVVTAQDPAEIEVGHIITYHVPGLDDVVVSHRVIEVKTRDGQTTFRTKGDENERPDAWTAQVTGNTAWRMRMAVPGLGWAVAAFRAPWIRVAASVLAPMLLAILALRAIWSRPQMNENLRRTVAAGSHPAPDVQTFSGPTGLSPDQLQWSGLVKSAGVWPQQQGGLA